MNYIKMSVEGNRLRIVEDSITTGGSINYDGCKFTFDETWDGFTKTAVFSINGADNYRVTLDGNECIIPSPCIEKEGILQIGLFGVSDNDVIITTNSVAHHVEEGVEAAGEWVEEDSSMIIKTIEELKRSAEEYKQVLSKRVSDEIDRLKTDTGRKSEISLQPDWYIPTEFTDTEGVDLLSKSEVGCDKFLDFRLNPLLNEFPDYVTRESIGMDASGEYSLYAYSFTPAKYEKTIFIAACIHGTDKCGLIALSHFLDCLCREYENDRTLNAIRNSVKIIVIPAVNPYAVKANATYNSNKVNIAYNFPYVWEACTRYRKGESAADQAETQAVINYLRTIKDDKFCAAIELHTSNFACAGRILYYTRQHSNCATALADIINNFNYENTYAENTDKAILAASANAYLSDYIADEYGVNSCQLVWSINLYGGSFSNLSITKYTEYIGNVIRVMVQNSRFIPKRTPQPFIKHFSWRKSSDSDVFTVNATDNLEKMPISSCKLKLDAPYNIALNGYVGLEVTQECTVKINPMLYQVYSPELDYDTRKKATQFTQEIKLSAGTHIVPIASVLQGYYSCFNYTSDSKHCEEVFFTLMLGASEAGKVKVTSFAVTVTANPSDAAKPVEISSPVGLCADYTSDDIPTQKISFPICNFTKYDSYFNN